ncbi:flavodoxin family protein [Sporolactobacillus sp. THM7-4]|nr:flavodoxin family protein [Sporolactobacillus sp. THM7-4]
MTRVIGILGSTNKNGLTAQLLSAILEGAQEQGCSTETLYLSEEPLRMTAPDTKNVTLDHLSSMLQSADCIVLASPTYWGDASGLMKNLLDCLRSKLVTFDRKGDMHPGSFQGKGYILVTTCYTSTFWNRLSGVTDRTLSTMEKPLLAAGMRRIGEAICTDTYGKASLPNAQKVYGKHLGAEIPFKLSRKGGLTLKRYIELFFMLAATILLVMGIEEGLSALHLVNLNHFWTHYLVFVLLTYLLLSLFLHYVAKAKHRRS